MESVRMGGQHLTVSFGPLEPGSKDIYHVAVEGKGTAKGDSSGTGRGAIEEAATQVIRGVNGLVECFSRNWHCLPVPVDTSDHPVVTLIPVIFTTARIWATGVDISEADVTKGQISLNSGDVIEKPWLWLQYHVSPGLKHTVTRQVPTDGSRDTDDFEESELGKLLEMEYARAIAVVGPNGINDFLTSPLWTV